VQILDYIALGTLVFQGGAQITKRPSWVFKAILVLAILAIFGTLGYWTLMQYKVWNIEGAAGRYFLPPHQSWNFFINYVLARFWAPYLVSLAAAILFFISAKLLNKKRGGQLFYDEEFYLSAAGFFVAGHPLWLVYLIVTITIHFLFSNFYFLFSKRDKDARLSFQYLWVPIGILVILLREPLLNLPFISVLRFTTLI
jgi:hypothetical protein